MKKVIKDMADELAPDLSRRIDRAVEIGDPEDRAALTEFLWDNKIGILRILEAVATEKH